MSRILYLLRHGRALDACEHGLQADHARRLSTSGLQEIDRLVESLREQDDFAPDRVMVSSATRTHQTAERFGLPHLQLRDDYYNADPAALLAAVTALKDDCASAMVVAHNPGISWLAASLLRPASCAGFSPGSMVALQVPSPWCALKPGTAQLLWRLDPPDYAARLRQQR